MFLSFYLVVFIVFHIEVRHIKNRGKSMSLENNSQTEVENSTAPENSEKTPVNKQLDRLKSRDFREKNDAIKKLGNMKGRTLKYIILLATLTVAGAL